jgi:hypothetical protein
MVDERARLEWLLRLERAVAAVIRDFQANPDRGHAALLAHAQTLTRRIHAERAALESRTHRD